MVTNKYFEEANEYFMGMNYYYFVGINEYFAGQISTLCARNIYILGTILQLKTIIIVLPPFHGWVSVLKLYRTNRFHSMFTVSTETRTLSRLQ